MSATIDGMDEFPGREFLYWSPLWRTEPWTSWQLWFWFGSWFATLVRETKSEKGSRTYPFLFLYKHNFLIGSHCTFPEFSGTTCRKVFFWLWKTCLGIKQIHITYYNPFMRHIIFDCEWVLDETQCLYKCPYAQTPIWTPTKGRQPISTLPTPLAQDPIPQVQAWKHCHRLLTPCWKRWNRETSATANCIVISGNRQELPAHIEWLFSSNSNLIN